MNRILKRLDSVHASLLQTVLPLDAVTFNQRPSEKEWSVGEIVQHLCLVEERVIKDLAKAIDSEPRRVGWARRLIPTSIVSSRLLRVKAPKAVNPLAVPDKAQVIENFELARKRLKDFCRAHPPSRLRNLVFKHPFLGEIDGVATVSFVSYHERRHFKQIREVLKKIKYDPRNDA
jgi:DinB superfamily